MNDMLKKDKEIFKMNENDKASNVKILKTNIIRAFTDST